MLAEQVAVYRPAVWTPICRNHSFVVYSLRMGEIFTKSGLSISGVGGQNLWRKTRAYRWANRARFAGGSNVTGASWRPCSGWSGRERCAAVLSVPFQSSRR
jgi:hypothetical protein